MFFQFMFISKMIEYSDYGIIRLHKDIYICIYISIHKIGLALHVITESKVLYRVIKKSLCT